MIEADGGELTDELRALMYEAEGEWSLVIDDLGAERILSLRAAANATGLPPREILTRVRDHRPVMVGALVELELVELALAPLGVRTRAERVS